MGNFTIDREKFKELLVQFKGDISYQTELVKILLNQLPDNYVNELVNTLYYERLYKGTYYIIQHHLYPQDRKIVQTFDECFAYLKSICFDEVTIYQLKKAVENNTMICGYYVTRYKNKEDK